MHLKVSAISILFSFFSLISSANIVNENIESALSDFVSDTLQSCECPQIMLILIDGCSGQDNEFLVMWSGSGFNTSNLTLDISSPNDQLSPTSTDINSGELCSWASPSNNLVAGDSCEFINYIGLEEQVPPNSIVILFTSLGASPQYDFSNLCSISPYPIYVLQNDCDRFGIGAFTNGTGSNNTQLRTTKILLKDKPCIDSLVYTLGHPFFNTMPSMQQGDYVIKLQDGSIEYGNVGCSLPEELQVPEYDEICNESFCSSELCNGNIISGDYPVDACVICDLSTLDGYVGTSAGFTATITPNLFCGSVENNQFFAFVAPQSDISIEIATTYCLVTSIPPPPGSGLQAQIYETDDACFDDWVGVSDCYSVGSPAPFTVTASNLTPGNVYYLMIDGFNGDICDFTINVTNPSGGNNPDTLPIPEGIQTNNQVCLLNGMTNTNFSVINAEDGYNYEWTVNGAIQPTSTSELDFSFSSVGLQNVCVTANNLCYNSQQACISVDIGIGYETTESIDFCISDIVVCAGQTISPTPTQDTIIQFVFQAADGCDSIVYCDLNLFDIDTTFVSHIICSDNAPTLCDTVFATSGIYTYSCMSFEGCDSVIVMDLTLLPLDSVFINAEVCQGDSYVLGSSVFDTEGNYEVVFDNYQGCDSSVFLNLSILSVDSVYLEATICQGDSLEFSGVFYSQEGIYTNNLSSQNGCDSLVSLQLNVTETPMTNIDLVACFGTTVLFGGAAYGETGTYQDTVLTPEGCDSISTLNLTVLEELTVVDTIITADVGSANNGTIALQLSNGTAPYEFNWSNGETSQNLENLAAGFYELMVTDANGCLFFFIFEVPLETSTDILDFGNNFSIFPNPVATDGTLNIQFAQPVSEVLTIQIFDIAGRLIEAKVCTFGDNRCLVNAPAISGVYWLAVYGKQKSTGMRVLVY